jgi:lysophosphatidylcholine acyltransferase/lyso-PAF acetyltransferase
VDYHKLNKKSATMTDDDYDDCGLQSLNKLNTSTFDKNNNNINSKYTNVNANTNATVDSEINPFINDVLEKLTSMQKFLLVIISLTIAPLRLIGLITSLLILWVVGIVIAKGLSMEKPVTGWRKKLYPLARFLSRCVFFFASIQWISIRGKPDMKVPIMAIAPHTGFLDSLLTTYLNFVTVVGRTGSDQVLLFGNLTKMTQPLIVDRESKQARTNSIKQIVDRSNSKDDWPPVSLFVEGTCTNTKALCKFKAGAFVPGKPVQPVCIRYSRLMDIDNVSWTWKGPTWYEIVWLNLCQLHTTVEFHFLDVYYPSDEERVNAELFSENVRILMGNYLNTPLSDYSYDDGRTLMKAQQCKLPWKIGQFKVHDLKASLPGISTDAILTVITVYSKFANLSTGMCYIDSFCANMGLVVNSGAERFFQLFDKANQAQFSFKEFIQVFHLEINSKENQAKAVDHIRGILNNLDRFKTDNHATSFYTQAELIAELKSKFSIEFQSFDRFSELKAQSEKITKEIFESFLNKSPLHLYLIKMNAAT